MPTTITTTTLNAAAGQGNQNNLDRTSNGVLWAVYTSTSPTSGLLSQYSIDGGTTWSAVSQIESFGNSFPPNSSFFIDSDDYAHVVYKSGDTAYIRYRRGTPNAGRTAWTWSAAFDIEQSTIYDAPDLVAFRTPGSSPATWDVPVVFSCQSSTTNRAHYTRLRIANDGSITKNGDGLIPQSVTWKLSIDSYGQGSHTQPSIDFYHTGDGKTVKDGTPHLFTMWSAGNSGASYGVRFKKATYSSGSWTFGPEQSVNSAVYYGSDLWGKCMFDGTRVVMVTFGYGGGYYLHIKDRDVADTTTTDRLTSGARSGATNLWSGSATYDKDGNIHILGAQEATSNLLNYEVWNRSSGTLGSPTTIEALNGTNRKVSFKRGTLRGSRLEYMYTKGSASPYTLAYNFVNFNNPPSVTLATIGTFDPRAAKTISWTFSDPDSGNVQTAYELDYRVSGGTWASLSTGTTASSYNVPANFFTDETNYEVRVRVSDGVAWSAYDTETFRADSWTYYPQSNPAYRDAVLGLKPSVYYRLGESSGTVAYEEVSGQNGEHRNAVTLGQDGALAVANTAAKYPNAQTNSGNTRIPKRIGATGSISMWVDTTSWAADNLPHGVFQSGDHSTTNYAGWLALFRWQGADMVNSPFYFRIVNDAGVLKDLAMNWQTYFGTTLGWHQITATWGNGSMALYVDGTQVASRNDVGTYSGDQSVNGSAYSLIGYGHQYSGYGTTIDEVAVFDKVLSAADISNLYSLRTSVSDSSPAYADIIKADEPVGYWRLGETSGTVAVDSSGNDLNGTYMGSPALGVTGAIANDSDKAVTLSSGGLTYISVPNMGSAETSANISAEAWAKIVALPAGAGETPALFSEQYPTGQSVRFTIAYDTGGMYAGYYDNAWHSTAKVPITLGEWAHWAATFDGATLRLYKNGVEVASLASTAPLGVSGGGPWYIGRRWDFAETVNGSLDEAAIYSRALSAAEIKRHYDAGKGRVIAQSTKFDTTGLVPDEYEIQVRALDQDDTGAWSAAGTFILEETKNFIYVSGEWLPVQKQQYWINSWRYGEATNF